MENRRSPADARVINTLGKGERGRRVDTEQDGWLIIVKQWSWVIVRLAADQVNKLMRSQYMHGLKM